MSNNDSKGKLFDAAKAFGSAARSTADSIGKASKTAAASLATSVKEGSEQLSEMVEKKKYEDDLKKYAPIFVDQLTSPEFVLPNLIRIVGEDVRRNVKACAGAIGFYTKSKHIKILNIYKEHVSQLGSLEWYPYIEETVYHVDPCHSSLYIRMEDYFAYLKKVRVNELTTIAQNLGAKHVEVILKSKSNHSTAMSGKASGGIGKKGFNAQFSQSQQEFVGVEVAAKVDFSGNAHPVKPIVVYFRNESDILALVEMRMHPENGNLILSKSYSLQYSNTSGIKTSDAENIDIALSSIGCGLSRSVASEALTESNTLLEYNIVF